MAYTNRVDWEPLRSLDTATMVSSSTYYNVGTALLHPSYKLKIVNNSNVLVTLSINGTSDIDVAPANSFWLYDETQAQFPSATVPAIPAGTQISVKSAAAGIGLVYLVSQYIISN